MEVRGRGWGLEVCQTPSAGIRHPSFKVEEGAGKRCSECGSGVHVVLPRGMQGGGGGGGMEVGRKGGLEICRWLCL